MDDTKLANRRKLTRDRVRRLRARRLVAPTEVTIAGAKYDFTGRFSVKQRAFWVSDDKLVEVEILAINEATGRIRLKCMCCGARVVTSEACLRARR